MVAAFTENFDQITRKERRSPALKGTMAAGAAGLAAFMGVRFEAGRGCAAKAQRAPIRKTQAIASISGFAIGFRLEAARPVVLLYTPLCTLPCLTVGAPKIFGV